MKLVNEKLLEKILKSILNTDRKIVLLDKNTPKSVTPDVIVAKDVGSKYEFYKVKDDLHDITDVVYDSMEKIDLTYNGKLSATNERLSPLMETMIFGDMPVIYMGASEAKAWLSTFGTAKFYKYALEKRQSVGYVINGLTDTTLFLAHIHMGKINYKNERDNIDIAVKNAPEYITDRLPGFDIFIGDKINNDRLKVETELGWGDINHNNSTMEHAPFWLINLSMFANSSIMRIHGPNRSLSILDVLNTIAQPYVTCNKYNYSSSSIVVNINKRHNESSYSIAHFTRGVIHRYDKYKYLKIYYGNDMSEEISSSESKGYIYRDLIELRDVDRIETKRSVVNYDRFINNFTYAYTHELNPTESSYAIYIDMNGIVNESRNDIYINLDSIKEGLDPGDYTLRVLFKLSATKDTTEDPEYPDIPVTQSFIDTGYRRIPIYYYPTFFIKFNVPSKN